MKFETSNLGDKTKQSLIELQNEKIVQRIWQKDFTVWRNEPDEISNRLGWLDCIEVTKKSFEEINTFVEEIRKDGFTDALLMGMGGSSLAPEVFRSTFGLKKNYLDLHVLDCTHPDAIHEYEKNLDINKTLYIVSTKSGGTVETMSFMKYFFTSSSNKLIKQEVSKHFIAITDPGSGLEEIAKKLVFRKIFINDPDIGGRFSALSLFGIVPAALIGIDLNKLFEEASKIIIESKKPGVSENSIARLGVIIGSLAKKGIDKLTFILSPQLKNLGGWLEQLIAESTGKEGKGILPVDLEPIVPISDYGKDRVFIYLKIEGDDFFDNRVSEIKNEGFPLVEIEIADVYQLGAEFFRWEFATAVAGHILDVQPFDQPNVESAKIAARVMMKEYQDKGKLPDLKPTLESDGIKIFSAFEINNIKEIFSSFLSESKVGKNYVSIQAYLKPEEETWQQLQSFRLKILQKYGIPTTLGYGPRFLHSTGQLHKGDSGNGFFIQFISGFNNDAPIPDEAGKNDSSISFGNLIKAQALGDRQALVDNKRNVLTIDLWKEGVKSLSRLTA